MCKHSPQNTLSRPIKHDICHVQVEHHDAVIENMDSTPVSSIRHTDLTLQIPPNDVGSFATPDGSTGNSSTGGFLHALSFKSKMTPSGGERSSLVEPDPNEAPETLKWIRCTSLPVTPASNLPPQIVVPPLSTRAASERQKTPVIFFCTVS